MSASGPNEHIIEAASGPDRRYFSEAVRWENDVIRTVKRSRLTAWLVAVISFALACLALTCLALLLPLKSFEPYVIEVDKTTGFMEIKQPLADGDLTQNEAIARMYVVRYLQARETYDPATVKDNFDLAQLLSARDAARDLFALFSPSNADNPVTRYGRETRVGLKIKSIQLPNALTAVIRFSTQRTGRESGAEEHWVSLLHCQYAKAPMPNEWRFENPLGFQVVDYRRDQESVSGQGESGGQYQP